MASNDVERKRITAATAIGCSRRSGNVVRLAQPDQHQGRFAGATTWAAVVPVAVPPSMGMLLDLGCAQAANWPDSRHVGAGIRRSAKCRPTAPAPPEPHARGPDRPRHRFGPVTGDRGPASPTSRPRSPGTTPSSSPRARAPRPCSVARDSMSCRFRSGAGDRWS